MERIAGITSNTVPWEILRAAGYAPRLLDEDETGPTPLADHFMEDVFDPRIRVIFDRLSAGAWNHLKMVVIPRTSEQEHKLYLYLREVARTKGADTMPRLYLYNLLHTRFPESYNYGLERTREMVRDLEASEDALHDAIAESNRARACVRHILQKRQDGLLEGSTAIEWIHGFYTEDRNAFSARISKQLALLNTPIGAGRPRIMIKGAPLRDASLHRRVEASGGYVASEDDWRGSRAAGDTDVHTEGDPVAAIFEKYFYDEVSPRIPSSKDRDAWFKHQTERVDGVIFYMPLTDDVVGWDYPRQVAFLLSQKIPSVLIRDNNAPIAAFIRSLPRR